MKKIFNIHIVVDNSARQYCDYLIKNSLHTAKDSSRLFFFCYTLDNSAQEFFQNDSRLSGCYPVYKMKGAYRLQTLQDLKVYIRAKLSGKAHLGGSNGHSAGLNCIMKNLPNVSGHNIIADSDVALLTHNWDEITEKYFENFHLLGTTYEPIGGFSSGNSKVQTYKDFPNANWLALREDCDISDLDWMPQKEKNIQIDSEEKSKLFNLPIGYEMVCDGGWKFPEFCFKKNYKAKAMRHIKPTSDEVIILKTMQDYNEEYQLDGKPFVGHQRGGSRHAFRASDVSIPFYDCVEKAVGIPEA